NPFDGGGQPLAGNPNTLTFYPDNFLYLILPAHVAFILHFLIHLILGWVAMRALARSSFAAWMWVLSGMAVSAMSFYSLITAIALPQIIAYADIAGETERGGHGYSAATVLAASLEPKRLVELVAGPLLKPSGPHLFPTLLLGIIIIPALFRRSRYALVAAVML